MELCYYKGKTGNFGDDLNPYIFDYFFKKNNRYEGELVYFIGTILFDDFAKIVKIVNHKDRKKIVIGAGVRYVNNPPSINETWDVRFLRGPLSSLVIYNDTNHFVTDPAYLIRMLPIYNKISKKKKYKVSVMPHFFSLDKIDWLKLCNELQINFIDPSDRDVEKTIMEIAESEFLVTEAMHGAIVADAIGTPWKRFRFFSKYSESELVSEFKWADWLFSMNLKNQFSDLYYNKYIRVIDQIRNFSFLKGIRYKQVKNIFSNIISEDNYQLSNETLVKEKTKRLLEEIKRL